MISKLKTVKSCEECHKEMEVGANVSLEFIQSPYKHYKFRHPKCALKYLERRYQEHIRVEAPEIVLEEFRSNIAKFKQKLAEVGE